MTRNDVKAQFPDATKEQIDQADGHPLHGRIVGEKKAP